jgi:hypothetical protein
MLFCKSKGLIYDKKGQISYINDINFDDIKNIEELIKFLESNFVKKTKLEGINYCSLKA